MKRIGILKLSHNGDQMITSLASRMYSDCNDTNRSHKDFIKEASPKLIEAITIAAIIENEKNPYGVFLATPELHIEVNNQMFTINPILGKSDFMWVLENGLID